MVGRSFGVIAGGTGRARAIGSAGCGRVMDGPNEGQASRQEVGQWNWVLRGKWTPNPIRNRQVSGFLRTRKNFSPTSVALRFQPYQPPAYQRRLVAVPVVRPEVSQVVVPPISEV